MTVIDVFDAGMALLATDRVRESALARFSVKWVNLALCEALNAENSIRANDGRSELKLAPELSSDGDEIPYSYSLVRGAFPFYIAWLAAKDDEDIYWAEVCRAGFISALAKAAETVPGVVEDLY